MTTPFNSLTLTVLFFSFTLHCVQTNSVHTTVDTHTHTHTQAGNPSFHFPATAQWSTTLRSTSHNLDKHIYSWFLRREGWTVNAGWQDRHISLSGSIFTPSLACTTCTLALHVNTRALEDTQFLYKIMLGCHWESVIVMLYACRCRQEQGFDF